MRGDVERASFIQVDFCAGETEHLSMFHKWKEVRFFIKIGYMGFNFPRAQSGYTSVPLIVSGFELNVGLYCKGIRALCTTPHICANYLAYIWKDWPHVINLIKYTGVRTLAKCIRERRGKRVDIKLPIFHDVNTPKPFNEVCVLVFEHIARVHLPRYSWLCLWESCFWLLHGMVICLYGYYVEIGMFSSGSRALRSLLGQIYILF